MGKQIPKIYSTSQSFSLYSFDRALLSPKLYFLALFGMDKTTKCFVKLPFITFWPSIGITMATFTWCLINIAKVWECYGWPTSIVNFYTMISFWFLIEPFNKTRVSFCKQDVPYLFILLALKLLVNNLDKEQILLKEAGPCLWYQVPTEILCNIESLLKWC